jgi:hypothetical protein
MYAKRHLPIPPRSLVSDHPWHFPVLPLAVNGWTFLSVEQPTFAVRENGLFFISSLQLAAFKAASCKLKTKPVSCKLEKNIRFHGFPNSNRRLLSRQKVQLSIYILKPKNAAGTDVLC